MPPATSEKYYQPTKYVPDQIDDVILRTLRAHPRGLRYSDLCRLVKEHDPSLNAYTIKSRIFWLHKYFPAIIERRRKGFYIPKVNENYGDQQAHTTNDLQNQIRHNIDFHKTLANWLTHHTKIATAAWVFQKPLETSLRAAPDVVGLRQNRHEMINTEIKFTISLKVIDNINDSMDKLGQSIVCRNFSHESYLAVPLKISVIGFHELMIACEANGIGIITYCTEYKDHPSFSVELEAKQHHPSESQTKIFLSHFKSH